MALLNVKDLSVSYPGFDLHPLSFALDRGEILAVVGESGSGKTTLAKAVACLLEKPASVNGSVVIDGRDILAMDERERRSLRMTTFSICLQNTVEWLNPTLSLRGHLREILRRRGGPVEEAEMGRLMVEVGLDAGVLERGPLELSGGMAQKFLLACALALEPALVLLDEPTSSLDSASRRGWIDLIRRLNRERGTAFLLITHDVGLALELSSRLMVLYEGHVMEEGPTGQVVRSPRHPYTRGLFHASMSLNPAKDIWGIRPPQREASRHSCPFCARCTQAQERCFQCPPELEEREDGRRVACHRGGIIKVLEGQSITKRYGQRTVLSDCSISIHSGEIVSVVGRSGTGKTTLARVLGGYDENVAGGSVFFEGRRADFRRLHRVKHGVQMVFQDSAASLDRHMTVYQAVSEPLMLSGEGRAGAAEAVRRAVADVGLPEGAFLERRIRELSGGQMQRVAVARALTMEPALLVADEPTSMLDPSACATLIRLLKSLQNRRGFSMLMVTHDLICALKISDSIYVMRDDALVPIQPSDYVRAEIDELL